MRSWGAWLRFTRASRSASVGDARTLTLHDPVDQKFRESRKYYRLKEDPHVGFYP